MKRRLITQLFSVTVILTLVFGAAAPAPTQAAGVYTHNWFVEKAVQRLAAHGGYSELVDILNRYPPTVNFGAMYPDSTYGWPDSIDANWGEDIHDTNTAREVNYVSYVRDYLTDQGYNKLNSELQMGYYRAFLDDPNYPARVPPFRAALMSLIKPLVQKHNRTVEDEKKIAFLFGLIAHQEADIPWHIGQVGVGDPCPDSSRTTYGMPWGLECQAIKEWGYSEGLDEAQLDGILYYYGGENIEHRAEFVYYPTIKPTILDASDIYGKRATCNRWYCTDPLDDGEKQLETAWALRRVYGAVANPGMLDNLYTYVPGGINHGSAFVGAAWMQAWDLMKYSGPFYVKPAATGTGDCESWANACGLNYALRHSIPGQEIWVQKGVYTPATISGHTPSEDERNATFQLYTGVSVYGGFNGNETALSQRDWYNNTTILSGDIDGNDNQTPVIYDMEHVTNNDHNSFHVVLGAKDSTLDGFVITGGYANIGREYKDYGGGMLNSGSNSTLKNVTFTGNYALYGGGMSNIKSAAPKIANVTMINNQAVYYGGAMLNDSSSPTFFDATVSGNSTTNVNGMGGGIYNRNGGSPSFHNLIVWDNSAGSGVQIYNNGTSPTVSDSVIQGGYPYGGSKIYIGNPMLLAPGIYSAGDPMPVVGIDRGSSATNKGNPAYCSQLNADQRNQAYKDYCDIGAVEYTGAPSIILYVKPDEQNPTGNCLDWSHACSLQTALTLLQSNGAEIWVMEGIYHPSQSPSRTSAFLLPASESIYGGFPYDTANPSPTFGDRDPDQHLTILSGDITKDDSQQPVITDIDTVTNNTNNSYHVVIGAEGATLDGFTVTAGYADTGAPGCNTNSGRCGGGMANVSLTSNPISVFVANMTFTGNYAIEGGGAVYNQNSVSSFSRSTFRGNKAAGGAGAVYNYLGGSAFTNVIFSGNHAPQNGGAVNNFTSSGEFNRVTFDDNHTDGWGGAIIAHDNSSPSYRDVTFSNNSAANGGAVSNQSNTDGGGKYFNVTFFNNAATWEGGGMNNDQRSSPLLTNVTFYSNTAINAGGAIANLSYSSPTMVNMTIVNNSTSGASSGGGAIYNYNSFGNVVWLQNSIVWGNTSHGLSSTFWNNGTYTQVHIDDSVVEGGCPANFCGNVYSGNPLLGTFGDHGGPTQTIPIFVSSSAINKGNVGFCNSNPLKSDQRGIPYVGRCDIGAYEYDYTGPYYVNVAAAGSGDCQSWGSACTLQTALSSVSSGDEIWAKQGTHLPTSGSDRSISFSLVNGVGLYGGFDGTETARDQRDPAAHMTTLCGDIGASGTMTDNSYHVVYSSLVEPTTVLDGFTITDGNANYGNNYNDLGAGMLNNHSSPTVSNVSFTNNQAYRGGGMANIYTSAPQLLNLTFFNNHADTDHGGGLWNFQSSPSITNATFTGNMAKYGAAISNMDNSNPVFKNITVKGNGNASTLNGGGMDNTISCHPLVSNSIFWGNAAGTNPEINDDTGQSSSSTVQYSVIQGGFSGGTNIITANPLLGTLGNHGGSTSVIPLGFGSSAIDKADDGNCPAIDQRGAARPQGAHCDIGAYELKAFFVTITSLHGQVVKTPAHDYYFEGESLQVSVTPDPHWIFTVWSGDLTGTTNPVTLTPSKNMDITANFIIKVFLPLLRR